MIASSGRQVNLREVPVAVVEKLVGCQVRQNHPRRNGRIIQRSAASLSADTADASEERCVRFQGKARPQHTPEQSVVYRYRPRNSARARVGNRGCRSSAAGSPIRDAGRPAKIVGDGLRPPRGPVILQRRAVRGQTEHVPVSVFHLNFVAAVERSDGSVALQQASGESALRRGATIRIGNGYPAVEDGVATVKRLPQWAALKTGRAIPFGDDGWPPSSVFMDKTGSFPQSRTRR